ncbi:hypothetical protein BD309DRAFT_636849 [Dichomitus squalens]|nr:hypothetical protein BD309DRAFT_636849 [Dichomitus squalens]
MLSQRHHHAIAFPFSTQFLLPGAVYLSSTTKSCARCKRHAADTTQQDTRQDCSHMRRSDLGRSLAQGRS